MFRVIPSCPTRIHGLQFYALVRQRLVPSDTEPPRLEHPSQLFQLQPVDAPFQLTVEYMLLHAIHTQDILPESEEGHAGAAAVA